MKKARTQLIIAVLIIVSISASIYINIVSHNSASTPQTEVLKAISEETETPVESILPEVQVVKTVLRKYIER